jgi:hypothetical protein
MMPEWMGTVQRVAVPSPVSRPPTPRRAAHAETPDRRFMERSSGQALVVTLAALDHRSPGCFT